MPDNPEFQDNDNHSLIIKINNLNNDNYKTILEEIFPSLFILSQTNIKSLSYLLYSIISKKNPLYLKILSSLFEKRRNEISKNKLITHIFNKNNELNIVELFNRTISNKKPWIEELIEACSYYLLENRNIEILSDILNQNNLNFAWILIMCNIWKENSENSEIYDLLNQIIKYCKNEDLDNLQKALIILQSCQKGPLNNQQCLVLLQQYSILRVLHQASAFDYLHQDEIINLLSQNNNSNALKWDQLVYNGFRILYTSLNLLLDSIEMEKMRRKMNRFSKKATTPQELIEMLEPLTPSLFTEYNSQTKNNPNPTIFENLYEEKITKKLKELKTSISELYPLNFRLELLEAIFSILFIRGEDLNNDPQSSDSGAEGEDTDVRTTSQHIRAGSTDRSENHNSSGSFYKQMSHASGDSSGPSLNQIIISFSRHQGFLCNESFIRDILNFLKDSLLDTSAAHFRSLSENNSSYPSNIHISKIPMEKLQSRLQRVTQYVMEASWRFSLCSSTRNVTRPWFYFIETEDNSDSDDNTKDNKDSRTSPICRGSSLPTPPSTLINLMLSSHSSLTVRCLSAGHFKEAAEAVQLCQPPEPNLASQVNFANEHRKLISDIETSMENYYFQKNSPPFQQPSSSKGITLASIKQVTSASLNSTSITSQVETFLHRTPLPSYTSNDPHQGSHSHLAALIATDLALTIGNRPEHSSALITIASAHSSLDKAASPCSYYKICQDLSKSVQLLQNEETLDLFNKLEFSCEATLPHLLRESRLPLEEKGLALWIAKWKAIDENLENTMKALSNYEGTTLPHNSYRKLIQALKIGKRDAKPSILYLQRVYSYLKVLSSVYKKYSNQEINCYLSTLQREPDILLSDLIFTYQIHPSKLEPLAKKLRLNLVYAVVRGCCSVIPAMVQNLKLPNFKQVKMPVFSWGSVVLNPTEWDVEKTRHPELAVRCLLEDLYSALSVISSTTLILNSKITEHPEIATILNDTAELAYIDISLLTPGDETTSFCINLYNLIMLHGLLVLGANFGLFSMEPLLKISSLGCCSYRIGGLGRVNLLDLQRKLLGATLIVAEDIFPETIWPIPPPISNPKHIFSLVNGRSDSPTLRIIYSESSIEDQIQENYQAYFESSIKIQENKEMNIIYIPSLILDFLEASNLDNNSEQLTALIHQFIPQQNESKKVIITVDDSNECHCVLNYSSENLPSHYKPQVSRLHHPKQTALPEHIFQFLERHCWLLGVLVRKINQNETDVEADTPPAIDHRLQCLEQAARSDGASTLAPLYNNSNILAALHHPPASASGLWCRLYTLIQERDWPHCVEMLCALSEIGHPLGPQLEFAHDVIFAKLASQPDSPWLYIEYIGCPTARTRAVLEHITAWPACAARPALSTLIYSKDPLLASEARDWLSRVIVHEQVMIKCANLELFSWFEALELSQKNPRFVLDNLIDLGEIDLCIEWSELHQVTSQLLWLVDERFILLLFQQQPPKQADARKILDSLPRNKSDSLCEALIESFCEIAPLECLRFIAQYLLDSPNSETLAGGRSERLWYILAGVSILEGLPENGPDKRDYVRHLVAKPWLIMEQFLMHTRLETLEKIVNNLRLYQTTNQQTFAINSPLTQSNIDALLRRYAAKALDLRVADPKQETFHLNNTEKFLTSQESSSKSSSTGWQIPIRPPPRSEWVPNEAKAECQCCSLVVFSMFNRRHHCRRCGRVVCHGCSTKTLQVEGYGSVPVRVCENCYSYETAAQNLNSSEKFSKSEEILVEPNPLTARWKLTCDEVHNTTVREEFTFEHAPSVSLCLAILRPHSEQAAQPRFLMEHAASMLHLLKPNPEIDHGLVIKMARSLLVAAKVRYARAGLPMGVSHCDQLLSHAELAGALLQGGGGGWYALEPLDEPHALRRLRDRLVEMELWPQALEVSTKGGLDYHGVWAAWGKACLRAGCWMQARQKFAHCIDQSESNAGRNPPLLIEIIDILEQSATARDPSPDPMINSPIKSKSPSNDSALRMDSLLSSKSLCLSSSPGSSTTSCTALAVLHTLSSLSRVAQGNYTQATPPANTVIIGPRIDPSTYAECRWYLSTYGTSGAHLDFLLRHDDLQGTVRFCREFKVEPDTFLKHVYLPCLRTGSGSRLQGLLLEEGGLESWKDYLRHACAHLERLGAWHILLELQQFIGDYIRAAMTCTRLYYTGANNYNHLTSSMGHLRLARTLLEKALHSGVESKGGCMYLSPEELERHLSTVDRQIEVTNLINEAEEAGRNPLNDLSIAFTSSSSGISTSPPTLFGSAQERLKVAILCLISADLPNDLGYSLCLRLISSYELRPLQVFIPVFRHFALSNRLQNIDTLINRIKDDFSPNIDWLENSLITTIKTLANRIAEGDSSHYNNVEALIRLLSDPIQKISAYIESRQLKSAYLLAVQHNRLEDVRRIGREAERLGQTVIQSICQKRLEQAKLT